ncbi:MAG: DUF819 family protein [Calditrichaeota bacterium]|nr:MAG: DUF819 family protein [Calditrichota bacterium]
MPLITNDAVVFGILITILAIIFHTSGKSTPLWRKFYSVVPSVLLAYLIPSVLNTLGIISGAHSNLYYVASRYLLPASLVLFTLSIDMKSILHLGPKALIMFLTGSAGIVIGGPLAILLVSIFAPDIVGGHGPDAVWRGLTTIAGSWIGGGANQTAMKEVFNVSDDLFASMLPVDIFFSNLWLALLLFGAGRHEKIDRWLKADSSAIDEVRDKVEKFKKHIQHVPRLAEVTIIMALGFGATGLAHWAGDALAPWIAGHFPQLARYSLTSSFFWIVVIATSLGLAFSFTGARKMEGAGASTMGSLFLYILVATIGMKMDISSLLDAPGLFIVGALWMGFHALLLIIIGKWIHAPFFFLAVGSQANVGGAASAPIVASEFHPALAPVGVLLAVLGYALGTYGAYVCGILMQAVAP